MDYQLYDITFNSMGETPPPEDEWLPGIGGYVLDDEAYAGRVGSDGYVDKSHMLVIPDTMYFAGLMTAVVSYKSKTITTSGGDQLQVCPLYNGNLNVGYEMSSSSVKVYFCDDDGVTIDSLTMPWNENSSSLSLIGHFDNNGDLDWVSIACEDAGYNPPSSMKYRINTTGFNSTIKNALSQYLYLNYKYDVQVYISKSLEGTDGFQISRFPSDWFSLKTYGTGTGQSQKYNDVVCRLDPGDSDIWDQSAAFCGDPPISTQPLWYYKGTYTRSNLSYDLSLAMGTYHEKNGYSFGSDICRKTSDDKYYNGVDLDQTNIVWTSDLNTPYDIPFQGGKIQLYYNGYNKFLRLLDSEDNVIDSYQFPYPVSGGGSTFVPGNTAYPLYSTVMSCYIAENNNHYYLIGLYQYHSLYDDDNVWIKYGYQTGGVYYAILHEFNANANTLLYHATDEEVIIPENPDDLTGDNISNQTSDPDHKNELGNQIPHPKYNDGEWDDHSTDGIRGSDQPREMGEHSEGKLDQQPGLPGLPSIPSITSTGFMHLFAPSDGEIQQLGQQLASDSVLSDLQKYLGNNPLDFIVGLHVVPGTYTLTTKKYKIDYGAFQSSPSMYGIADEFCELDYGELELKQNYASWLDFNPHTKMSIYLPYIGIKDIDPDRINGTLLKLKYYVDATTGSILAVLTSVRKDNENYGAEYLVGQWAGQALYTIPVTNVQHDNSINAVISIVSAAVSVGAGLATAGATTAAQVGAKVAAGAAIGNAALSAAKSQKTDITMQGSVSGSLSFFTAPDAYIQIEYPLQGRPDDYDHIIGMPSNITSDIAHQPFGNYIEFVNVDLNGLDAPPDEKNAILEMLKGGVYT